MTYKAGFFALVGMLIAFTGAMVALEARFSRTYTLEQHDEFYRQQFLPLATQINNLEKLLAELKGQIQGRPAAIEIGGQEQAMVVVLPFSAEELRKDARIRDIAAQIMQSQGYTNGGTDGIMRRDAVLDSAGSDQPPGGNN